MRINNFLCENFDEDKKGYVTIGDILHRVGIVLAKTCLLVFFGVIAIGGIYIMFRGVLFILNNSYPNDDNLGFAGLLLLVLVISLSSYFIYEHIKKIKIATCPLKEADKYDK